MPLFFFFFFIRKHYKQRIPVSKTTILLHTDITRYEVRLSIHYPYISYVIEVDISRNA